MAPDVVTIDRVTIRLLHMWLAGKHRSLLPTHARPWQVEGLFNLSIPIRRLNGAMAAVRVTVPSDLRLVAPDTWPLHLNSRPVAHLAGAKSLGSETQ